MQILVRSLSGKTIAVELGELSTVDGLKSIVASRENFNVDKLRLLYNGKQLHVGGKTLGECGITGGCFINVTAGVAGGCGGCNEELDKLNEAIKKVSEALDKLNR